MKEEIMIRKIDKLWFRLLAEVHAWAWRQAVAHCRREKQRRFRLLLAWQKNHLN